MNRAWLLALWWLGGVPLLPAQWQTVGDGMDDSGIRAMFYDSLGQRVYCFGQFTSASGIPVYGTAYWDGEQWNAMGSGVVNPFGTSVMAALHLGGDSVIVSGSFPGALGVSDTRYTALWDGDEWRSIGPGGTHGIAWRMLYNEDGLTLAGQMDSAASVPVDHLARYHDGQWSALSVYPTWPQFVSAMALAKFQGTYIVGGNINVPGVKEIGWLDGDTLRQLGPGILGDSWVNDMVIYHGDLYVGGEFYTGAGNAASGVMKWDGTSFSDPFPGVVYTGMVHALDVRNDELYLSGRATIPGSLGYYQLARFDGNHLCLFGKNINAQILDIAATETELFAAPNMRTLGLGGDTVNWIVRYDLSYPADTCIAIQTSLNEASRNNDGWTFAPNPAQDRVTVRSQSSIPTGSRFQIFDAMGRLLWTKSLAFTSPNTPLDVMVPSLSAGTLQARIVDEHGVVLTRKALVILGN